MWDAGLMRSLARLARPGAALATRSTEDVVRDALQQAGFEIERSDADAGQPHRLRARYAPRWRSFAPPAEAPHWPARSALVIGAGLAGAAVAAGFARRGWQVTVLEAAPASARGASAQPLCADHLHLSPDDNPLARLTRAAMNWRAREAAIPAGAPLGKLLLDADGAEAASRRAMLQRLCVPASFARQLSRDEACDAAGLALPRGGLWLPRCSAVEPAALVAAWLGTAGITLRTDAPVATLVPGEAGWSACDGAGRPLASGAIAILANAGDAARLAGAPSLALERVRGQSTLLARRQFGALRTMLGGGAYAAPLGDWILVGGNFDDGDALETSRDVDRDNLARLARMIGGDPLAWFDASRSGAVGLRFTTADRLPAIGAMVDEAAALRDAAALSRNDRLPLPRRHGLYGAFAFGSRGLLWATLAAQLLPALADGEPLPLESDLLRAIDPGRFVKRMLRRKLK
jgi:tRNA 5-methylaminomethyl-2-thiouridine biosynthesis bifunctional protein